MQSFLQQRRILRKIRAQWLQQPISHPDDKSSDDAPPATDQPSADVEKASSIQIVSFDGPSDPLNPTNYHWGKKLYGTIIISLIAFVVCMASSIDAPIIPQASGRFHVSAVTESLATALFLIGRLSALSMG